jgi:hypothetical protein
LCGLYFFVAFLFVPVFPQFSCFLPQSMCQLADIPSCSNPV